MLSMKRLARERDTTPSPNVIGASSGMTLIEVIVAFVILMIALVAFAQFMTKALDYARKVRHAEMAQLLAQAKMEELIRKLPAEGLTFETGDNGSAAKLLGERPAPFENLSDIRGEDLTPFMWVAEAAPAEQETGLANVNVYVYTVTSRIKDNPAPETEDDVYVSDDREWFTIMNALDNGKTEVLHGRREFTLSSAVALPQQRPDAKEEG